MNHQQYHRFGLDAAILLCPIAMKPFDLYHMVQFCSEEESALLRENQRVAHRVGYESEFPENKPLLGTSAHAMVGLLPYWEMKGRTHIQIPPVYLKVAGRHNDSRLRQSLVLFSEAVYGEAERLNLPRQRAANCFQPSKQLLYDVFIVYAEYIRQLPLTAEDWKAYRALAVTEVANKVAGNPDEALALAKQICELISKEFEDC